MAKRGRKKKSETVEEPKVAVRNEDEMDMDMDEADKTFYQEITGFTGGGYGGMTDKDFKESEEEENKDK